MFGHHVKQPSPWRRGNGTLRRPINSVVRVTTRGQLASSSVYIYNFIAIVLDHVNATGILVALHISRKNIYQLFDLYEPLGVVTSMSGNNVLLFTDVRMTLLSYLHDVMRESSASWLFQNLR